MVSSLTYRTSDITRWGGGLGSDLSAVQVDLNFWTLFSAVQAIEDHTEVNAGIDFINQPAGGNLFYIHLTDHRVLGPFVIPTAQWNPRGSWQPDTEYAAYDVVSDNGSLYLITVPHTSAGTFSPFATDGMGHNLYNLILSEPEDMLPPGGTFGQRLAKAAGSPFATEWVSDRIRMFTYIETQPQGGEVVLQYPVADDMTIPAGLVGSAIFQNAPTSTIVTYNLFLNGASIGSITFTVSPEDISVSFPGDVLCVPGDIITLVAPASPDAVQAGISFTLIAELTG